MTNWGAVLTLEKELQNLRTLVEAIAQTKEGPTKPIWYDALFYEFAHQVAKHGSNTPGNPDLSPNLKLNWLVEEVGEVARAINDKQSITTMRQELIQVAAIALKWVESLG